MLDNADLAARHYLYTAFQMLLGSDPAHEPLEAFDPRLFEEACAIAGVEAPATMLETIESAQADERQREALSSEYTKTLVGPGKLPAAPWESVQVSGDDSLFSLTTLDVRNAYRAQGFLPQEYPRVADDHVALECAFLAALALRALEAHELNRDDERAEALQAGRLFLEKHLTKWVDGYAAELSNSSSGFYAAVAAALAEFAHADLERLHEA